ncbi:Tma46 protein [Saccharomycopsis crataegensis]|uniref:Tma46 protein n=1 Tax=Saccharomycopsis crataegensis TaxID=43959 RepID=A0AAV5QL72_9ASCO|nr:Tma46 protein [Saccharomycopsis crataegensis]
MPPKKKAQQNDKKAQQKKRVKDVEDKTFGLKNKNKSKKVQKFVEQMQSQSVDKKKQEAMAKRRAEEKKAAELAKKESLLLAQSIVVQQKVPFGVDPRSVLCVLFKEGKCTKGARCKFSHDMNVGRKSEKRDIYTDPRDAKAGAEGGATATPEVSKHGNLRTTTDKICKNFLQAVENGSYGWFWVCPDGGDNCKYRHAVPEGYVVRTKEQRRLEQLAADSAPKISLEEFIELEKEKLGKDLIPITPESFVKWKKEHQLKKLNEKKRIAANGKKLLTGKEVVEKKYRDKLLESGKLASAMSGIKDDDENEDEEHGTIWDMSEFQKQLKDSEKDENIKDYGDGTTFNFDEAPKPEEKKEEGDEEKKEGEEQEQNNDEETKNAEIEVVSEQGNKDSANVNDNEVNEESKVDA